MLVCPEQNLVVVLPPKTASRTVAAVVKSLVPTEEHAGHHGVLEDLTPYDGFHWAMTVRNPWTRVVSWLKQIRRSMRYHLQVCEDYEAGKLSTEDIVERPEFFDWMRPLWIWNEFLGRLDWDRPLEELLREPDVRRLFLAGRPEQADGHGLLASATYAYYQRRVPRLDFVVRQETLASDLSQLPLDYLAELPRIGVSDDETAWWREYSPASWWSVSRWCAADFIFLRDYYSPDIRQAVPFECRPDIERHLFSTPDAGNPR